MRILQVHNFYRQAGGEDQVVAAEYDLLRSHGHSVEQFLAHNRELIGIAARVQAALHSVWNRRMCNAAKTVIRDFRPDIMHVHNTLAEISPAIYYAAASCGVPVVQTLHNYRLLCGPATLFRDGQICEKCIGLPAPFLGPVHRCYQNSVSASAAVSAIIATHRLTRTWSTKINRYIATTEFAKHKFVQGGLPASKITVKPNFLAHDPGVGRGKGNYVLFAGRFAPGKGVEVLLQAARQLPGVTWKLAGDGELASRLGSAAQDLKNVEFLGRIPHSKVLGFLQNAQLLIFPSVAYESLPMILIEALACGTPVICSDTPSLDALVMGGQTGVRFTSGNSASLASAVQEVLGNPAKLQLMRLQARQAYEANYNASLNHKLLTAIYSDLRKGNCTEKEAVTKTRAAAVE